MSDRRRTLTRIVSLALFVVALTSGRRADAAGLMNPGKWQVTLHTVEPLDAPPMTSTVCVTPETIARIAPPVSRPTDGCVVTAGALNGGALTYTMSCPAIGRTTTTTIQYAGETFSGSMTVQNPDYTIKQTIEAKRLGPCDAQ